MTPKDCPIRPEEADQAFAALPGGDRLRVALAVSGGSDSTALMVLFAEWLARMGRPTHEVTVLTVDHGLRPQSRGEAEAVGRRAGALGFQHAILSWTGEKPATGLQAAAREARYRLMAGHMLRIGADLLVAAHTADDQAETLLMRLARGSGLDGLAAMSPLAPLDVASHAADTPILLSRPLLGFPKARLRATLEVRGIDWSEDPSNTAPAFERTQVRARAGVLRELGLTGESLGLAARRLQRVRIALDRAVSDYCAPEGGRYRLDPCGFVAIDAPSLRRLPEELVRRIVLRAIATAGGSGAPVPLAKAETLVEGVMRADGQGRWTLARAMIEATPDRITVEREPGRERLPELVLAPAESAVWDGRFRVGVGREAARSFTVGGLGKAGLAGLRGEGVPTPAHVPANTLYALPAFRSGPELAAVPSLGYFASPALEGVLAAELIALGNRRQE